MMESRGAGGSSPDSLDAVTELVAGFGVGKRQLREALAILTERRQTVESLVRASALPRRTVESLLRAADRDLDSNADGALIRADRAAAYRDRFAIGQLRRSRVTDPLETQLAAHRALIAQTDADITAAPAARDALDHVAATAETVVRQ
jgi:N4-bis(aminopropyl)spermidine synthase